MKRYILAIVLIVIGTMTGHAQFAGANTDEYKTKTSTNYVGNVTRGYKGYIEIGMNAGGYATGVLYSSHGYLFNPYFYLGAGIGFEGGYTGYGTFALPIFIEMRTHLVNPNNKKHVPFLGLRGGGSVADEWTQGGYFNFFLGYRFKPNRINGAFNLSIGYQMLRYYGVFTSASHAFSFRLGYEF